MFSPGFPAGSDGKESAYNAGDPGLIPGLERSPREGNDHPPNPVFFPGESPWWGNSGNSDRVYFLRLQNRYRW